MPSILTLTRLADALPELRRVVARFPIAVMAAVLFTGFFLFDFTERAYRMRVFGVDRFPLAMMAAFLAATCVGLICEAERFDARQRLIRPAAVALIVSGLFWLMERVGLSPAMLLGGLALGVSLAPYLRGGSGNAVYWKFNHDLWSGAAVALIAAALFGAGCFIILETIRYLFGISLPHRYDGKIWAIAVGLVGPIYWLNVIPERLDEAAVEGPQPEFISRAIGLLVKFILVPLLLVYAVILHVYAIKIGIDRELPKGRLGWLVLSYGSVVAATVLAAFPTRDASGPLVQAFWQHWSKLLVVPLILLALAVTARIGQYGLTEARYIVVLAGIWLAVISGLHMWRRDRLDLRLIVGTLTVLALIASMGPLGMWSWPLRSQVNRMTSVLTSAGLLENGVVVSSAGGSGKLSAQDTVKVSSAVDYLRGREQLHRLRPMFEGQADDPFTAIGKPTLSAHYVLEWKEVEQLTNLIKTRLGVGSARQSIAQRSSISFFASAPAVFAVGSTYALVGPVSLQRGKPMTEIAVPGGEGLMRVASDGRSITVTNTATNASAVFDIAGPFGKTGSFGPGTTVPTGGWMAQRLARISGELPVQLVMKNVTLHWSDADAVVSYNLNFWIIVGGAP